LRKLLVTGGAGFIGSALIRQLIDETGLTVVNVDSLNYAGNLESLGEAREHPRHLFEHIDIRERNELDRVFREHRPDAVAHLAAETHVDYSIATPLPFVDTNVIGTANLLQAASTFWRELDPAARANFRLLHISTDEVYGDLGAEDPPFTEDTAYAPSSPYAASKAASDHLVRAWHRTYGMPVLVTHSCNNYGPYQLPDKLIPLMICNALDNRPLPVYGSGENVREWLHVDDHARALRRVLDAGVPGRTYDIGGATAKSNIDVVMAICADLDRRMPRKTGPYSELVHYVADRPGHDRRYAIAGERIRKELQWRSEQPFEAGLAGTIKWYLEHQDWLRQVRNVAGRRAADRRLPDCGPDR
jgi:dTDP-glucose 4,6-dehydratase